MHNIGLDYLFFSKKRRLKEKVPMGGGRMLEFEDLEDKHQKVNKNKRKSG